MSNQVNVIQIAGQGPPGIAAFTQTTANFTMPAVGGNVTVSVVSTKWMAVGQSLFIATAGVMTVASITDALTVVLTNPSPAIASNTAATTVIVSGAQVTAAGATGATGPAGGTAPWTDVAAGATVSAVAGKAYAADSTGSRVTFNLSSTPSDGDTVLVHLVGATVANGVAINANGGGITIETDGGLVSGTSRVIATPGAVVSVRYRASLSQWLLNVASGLTATQATNDLTGAGTQVVMQSTETVIGQGSGADTRGSTGRAVTTDGTTWVTVFSFTPPANSGDDWSVSVMGLDVTGAPPISGAFYRADIAFSTIRVGSAAPTLAPTTPAPSNVPAGAAAYSVQIALATNLVQVQVKGLAAKTVNWSAICQRMAVS